MFPIQRAPQSKMILEYNKNKTEDGNKLHNSSDNLLNSGSNEREVVEDIIESNNYKKILSSQLKNQLPTTTTAPMTVPTTIEQKIVEDIIGDNEDNSLKQVTANTDSNTSSSRIGSNHSSPKSSPSITTALQNDQQHNTAEETKKDDVYILEEDEDVKAFIELLRESQKKRRLTAPKCIYDIWDSDYRQRHEDTGDYMNLSYYSNNTVYYYKGDGTAPIEIKNPDIKTGHDFWKLIDAMRAECEEKQKEGKEYYFENYLLEHNLITKEDLAKKSPTGDEARERYMARLIINKYCRDIRQ